MKITTVNSITCKIGQNAKENWLLLDSISNKNFWFFHLSSFPSCYVILETENLTESSLKLCAEICKINTKYKNLKNIKVDYSQCKNIIKTDKLGEIEYISNRKVKQILI